MAEHSVDHLQMEWRAPAAGAAAHDHEVVMDSTVSLCPFCRQRVAAEIVARSESIYLRKHCPRHGAQMELLEANAAYYLRRREYDKPGTETRRQTPVARGCPFDCGLCPNHRQHTCIGLIEVTDQCRWACPCCYAGPGRTGPLPLADIERMLDFYVAAENGQAEVVQISGGEPADHPAILDILRLALSKPVKYVMLNTNGERVAEDADFADALAALGSRFEVYLQFDGVEPIGDRSLRGRDRSALRQRAVAALSRRGVPMTLVATVQAGVNEAIIGPLIEFGQREPWVRGVNFQPLAFWDVPPAAPARITMTGIMQAAERQTAGRLRLADFVPLPCNVERVALTYCFRAGTDWVPITRVADLRPFLPVLKNTFAFHADDIVQAAGPAAHAELARQLREVLRPLIPAGYPDAPPETRRAHFSKNVFRITVSSFLDWFNFEERAMRKECVHVLTPDLRRIPFSAYNLFHRERRHAGG